MFIGQPISYLGSGGYPSGAWRYPLVIPLTFSVPVAGKVISDFTNSYQSFQAQNAGIQLICVLLDANFNPLNLYGATSIALEFEMPSGDVFSRAASFLTNGMDGSIYYVTTATDIVETGLCYMQASVTIGGSTLTSQWISFEAIPNIA